MNSPKVEGMGVKLLPSCQSFVNIFETQNYKGVFLFRVPILNIYKNYNFNLPKHFIIKLKI